jgi:hypothetical protein
MLLGVVVSDTRDCHVSRVAALSKLRAEARGLPQLRAAQRG